MSVNLTTALQNLGGRDPNFVELDASGHPVASRQTGLVLLDSASVSWTSPGPVYNTLQATATVSGLPVATQAGQVPTSTGAGTTYTAQNPATPGMTLIQTQVLGAPAATVTFSAIPGTFTSLLLVANHAAASGGAATLQLNFNGDAGANYGYALTVNSSTSITGAATGGQTTAAVGASASASACSQTLTIPAYASGLLKSVIGTSFAGTAAAPALQEQVAAAWGSTAAITSLALSIAGAINFVTGSTFSLYGLA